MALRLGCINSKTLSGGKKMKPILRKVQLLAWVALIVATPFSLRYVVTEPYAVSYLGLYCLAFFGLSIVNILIGNLKLKKLAPPSYKWVIIVFLAAMLWGLVNTTPLSNGYGLWISRLLLPLGVGYITYLMIADGILNHLQGIQVFVLTLVLLFISGSAQFLGLTDYINPNRITGPYVTPNTFARYLEVLLLMTLPWILVRKNYWYLTVWMLGVLTLLSTISYNGTITLAIGLIMIIALIPREYLNGKIKIGIFSIFLLGVIVVGANLHSIPKYEVTIRDSRLSRLEYWGVAWQVIKDRPLTGIGIKAWELSYPDLVKQYGPTQPLNWVSSQPHNVFLDSWLKAGLPGVLAVTAFLLWPILVALSFFRRQLGDPNRWFALSILCSMTALLLFGVIDDPIWNDDIMLLVMTLDFMLAGLITQEVKQNG